MYTAVETAAETTTRPSSYLKRSRRRLGGLLTVAAMCAVGFAGPALAAYISPANGASWGYGYTHGCGGGYYDNGVYGHANSVEAGHIVRIWGERFGSDVHSVWFSDTGNTYFGQHCTPTGLNVGMQDQ